MERKTNISRCLGRLSALLCLFHINNLAIAAPSPYEQGVEKYNAGQYALAASALENAIKASPNNTSSHYYLGLSYLALKRQALARQQFEWVAKNSAEPTIKAYATSAMNALPGPPASTISANAELARPSLQDQQAKPRGRCKVLMFETSWCHFCHEFAPHFDEVAAKNRNDMDFERLDAEKEPNLILRGKYNIHSFPRLVYLDGSGNVLYNEGRGAFDRRVQELTAR
jgi:thiol-disulfide isomerase/thioredoxin